MELGALGNVFASLGTPLALVVVLIFVIYQMGKRMIEQADKNMESVQARCKEREDRLTEEIKECRLINDKAIDTIARYAEKLDVIQGDVKEIKSDISILMGSVHGGKA